MCVCVCVNNAVRIHVCVGGGMISGLAIAAKEINPNIKIIGVEPAKIPSMAKAVGGDTNMQPAVTTIADGINVSGVYDELIVNY
jgi:threonine dehydratase